MKLKSSGKLILQALPIPLEFIGWWPLNSTDSFLEKNIKSSLKLLKQSSELELRVSSFRAGHMCSSSAQAVQVPVSRHRAAWCVLLCRWGAGLSLWWGKRRSQDSGEKPLSWGWQRKEKPAPRCPPASSTALFFMTCCFIVPWWWPVPLGFVCQLSTARISCFRRHFTSVSHQEFLLLPSLLLGLKKVSSSLIRCSEGG